MRSFIFIVIIFFSFIVQATPLAERLKILDQNLLDITENEAITKKNIQTLEEEITELKKLSTEYNQLKEKYEKHAAEAIKTLQLNKSAIEKLTAFIATLPQAEKDKRERAQKEITEREGTDASGQTRLKHIRNLQESVNTSLESIKARLHPIELQLEQQNAKLIQHGKTLIDIKKKRLEVERAIKSREQSKK